MADDRTANETGSGSASAGTSVAHTAGTSVAHQIDPGQRQVAAVYAKAFMGVATGATPTPEQATARLAELNSLVDDVLAVHPKLAEVWASALVSYDDKAAMLDRILGGQASPWMLNSLKVLARHGRLDCLRAIREAAGGLLDELLGRQKYEVTTATPLTESAAETLTQKLRQMFGGAPELVRHTDPDLLGGIVLRVADTVLDGSVATRLARARVQMIDRSVHEIQRRRDRFSNPAGN